MAGRLIGNGSANSSTVASPSARRRTIERRVGSDKAAKTTSNRSGAVTVIVAVPPADSSQAGYLTEYLNKVKTGPELRGLDHPSRSAATSASPIQRPYRAGFQPRLTTSSSQISAELYVQSTSRASSTDTPDRSAPLSPRNAAKSTMRPRRSFLMLSYTAA